MLKKNKRYFLLGTVAAAALLAGCANLAPSYERPAAPVAPAWPNAAASEGQAAPELPWQSFYGADARLRELIRLALENNRDLRVALLNVEKARAQYRITDADRVPSVSLGYSRAPTATGERSYHTLGLQTSYEMDLFGKLKNNSDAAMASYLATAEGQRSSRIALVASVATTYLTLQSDEEQLTLARRTSESREDGLRLMRLKYDAGAASALDLSTSESAAGAARASLSAAQRQRDQDENALVLLIGQPLPAQLPAGMPLQAQQLPDVPAGLPSAVLAQRPDVLQAEQQLIAANANIGAARAAYFPSISLTASAGVASKQLSDLLSNSAWSLSTQLLMPIFDAGKTRANVEAAKASQGIAVAQYEKALQTAFKEVADALAGRATLDEQVRGQEQQAKAEAKRLELTELRYRNGASNTLELLDAQRSSFSAEQALLQVRLAQVLNRVQLYKALGGGLDKS